ncbi:MAG: hypothetical protein AB7O48_01235 [Cyclobacteriaceae bacterium]
MTKEAGTNPLKLIINSTTTIFIVLVSFYLGLIVAGKLDTDPQRGQFYGTLSEQVMNIGLGAWRFIRPLFTLSILLLITHWILQKLGINFSSNKGFLRPR